MTASGPAFAAGDYVVRYGLRGFRAALLGLLLWTALASMIAVRATGPSIPAAVALGIGEAGLLTACAVEIWRAARREVMFAVSRDGVYFGPGQVMDGQQATVVPWEQIGAIELFGEKAPVRGIRSSWRCIGALAVQDGTRLAYSRMTGWQVSRDRLDAVVNQYAACVPVIDGRAMSPVPA